MTMRIKNGVHAGETGLQRLRTEIRARIDDHIALQGGTAVAMLTSFMPEWHDESARWIDAVVKAAAAESDGNRQLLGRWVKDHSDRAQAALSAVARLALGDRGEAALNEARDQLDARCRKAGVPV